MHYDPKCLNVNHKCLKVCIDPNCNINNPFICQLCGNHHQKSCEIVDYKELVKKMHKIQGINKTQLLRYEEYVQQTFKTMMKSLQDEFVLFREQLQHINASNRITEFYQLLKSHKENKLSARFIGNILQQKLVLKNKYHVRSQAIMWSLSTELIQLQKKINAKLRYYYSLDQMDSNNQPIAEVDLEMEPKDMKKVEQVFRNYRQQLSGGILQNSINLIEPLFNKDIYNVQLLYRASQHNFSAAEFHSSCDGKKQTLTIAKTQYGNLVGGYSNVPWRSPKSWEYQQDPTNQTFIFSLHKAFLGLKFRPFKKNFTLGMHQNYGPSFGDDLVIYDKSNTSKGCWSNFPDCYVCKQKEIEHNQATIRNFIGVNDHYKKFNIIEWQVYKISFDRNEQQQRSFMQQYRKI